MNKSQKIYLSTGYTGNESQDKHIKVKLEQDVETLEFLTLSLGTENAYQNFNADYGVLVGKVIANGGIGIPNAKISVFIPLSDDDASNSDITTIYPYITPRDKNNEGKRYNLLPRVSRVDENTGNSTPKQAFGSFPIKEEIIGNETFLEVYKKYYKYSTKTNEYGDYMIFGVPVSTQTIHMSADITDIGEFSMNPASMVTNLGYSENLFNDDKTKIKPSNDLDDLPNIETQEINVDVVPFWGDIENFEIGITRQDFRIRAELKNTFIIFGSVFTDASDSMYGSDGASGKNIKDLYRITNTDDLNISDKRGANVTEKIYYYPASVSDEQIAAGIDDTDAAKSDGTDMMLLASSEYTVHKDNGRFVFIINCNRRKIVTDGDGTQTEVDDDSPNGLFTEFVGFVTLEIENSNAPINISDDDSQINDDGKLLPVRAKLKFPQHAQHNVIGGLNHIEDYHTKRWRRQNYKFTYNKFYSFSRFNSIVDNHMDNDINHHETFGYLNGDWVNDFGGSDGNYRAGSIMSSSDYFPQNIGGGFGANWLNLSVYLPQFGQLIESYDGDRMKNVQIADIFLYQQPVDDDTNGSNQFFLNSNTQKIAATETNTRLFSRSDLNWTDFIEVPIEDIQYISEQSNGINYDPITNINLKGKYRNGNYLPNVDLDLNATNPNYWDGECPWRGGKIYGIPSNPVDTSIYFFKGTNGSDCIQYLFDLGLIG